MPTTRDAIVAAAESWIGTMYRWGGESAAEGGVDCSGLVIDAMRRAGVPLQGRPIASQIGRMGTAVPLELGAPGDVLYYDNPGPTDHVAILTGRGTMIEAPTVGQRVRETAIRPPTSVRRLPEAGLAGVPSLGQHDPRSDAEKLLDDTLGDWAGGAMKVGVYVVGGLLAGGLVLAGVYSTVKKG